MINSSGIIQNNRTASEFIRKQMKLNKIYPILDKEQERGMIERYARLRLVDGKPTWNKDFECDFEWVGSRDELIEKLIMHNMQAVSNISTKHCQDTRDFDNMYAKGLFGLTRAANEFHPFKLITKVVGHRMDENGKKVPVREVVLDKNGNYGFIKFNTFAQWWIFKYVMDEFYSKSIQIDNNSISINELMRIHNEQSRNMTMENYITDEISPDIEPVETPMDTISAMEATDMYRIIHEYISESSELSAVEKGVLENMYYGGNGLPDGGTSSIKKLSTMMKLPQQELISAQTSALAKLKDFLYDEYGIESSSDVM